MNDYKTVPQPVHFDDDVSALCRYYYCSEVVAAYVTCDCYFVQFAQREAYSPPLFFLVELSFQILPGPGCTKDRDVISAMLVFVVLPIHLTSIVGVSYGKQG